MPLVRTPMIAPTKVYENVPTISPEQAADLVADAVITKKKQIATRLRSERSPRHVPDVIIQAPGIPMTLTGKKMEVPIRKLLLGASLDAVASKDATRNPEVLDWFARFAEQRRA